MAKDFEVTERTYSWGTVVRLYRDGVLVMFVDVFNSGDFCIYPQNQEK